MTPTTEQELSGLLQVHGLDPTRFGRGEAKTIRHLLEEIDRGETTITQDGGRLVRRVQVVVVNVFAHIGTRRFRLVEDRQVFADGRERRRCLTSVSEKMLAEEDVQTAVVRALDEELAITLFVTLKPPSLLHEEIRESPSYPGLVTEYTRHETDVLIDASQYSPEGYREVQGDTTTYFIWVDV